MTHTIDLGGAPAEEPCAQLGRTPGFERLNRLEVEVYAAALQARHGPPPPGCRFVPIDNAHDFGRYRTLGLALDEPAGAPARAYAEAVEEGLATWLEAGFTAPVSYTGARGQALRDDAGAVIVGALATTRPDPDGRFTLADFAVLHRNLRVAYPAEAASYDQLGLSPDTSPTATVDCRFRDAAGEPLTGAVLARAVCRAAIDAAAPLLAAAGIARIFVDYNGGGDEGQINEVRAEAEDGTSRELPALDCHRFRTGFDGKVAVDISTLADALEEIGTEALAAYHDGWEDNDGAFGTVTVDVAQRTATLDHNVRVASSELISTEL